MKDGAGGYFSEKPLQGMTKKGRTEKLVLREMIEEIGRHKKN
jgi:hypothetical protein